MLKDNRYINAGTNEVYRYGRKAVEKATAMLEPNKAGFISIPADGGKYWTIGTSTGKYGEFAKFGEAFFSVNSAGNVWAKAGSDKGEKLLDAIRGMINYMNELNAARATVDEEE